MKFIFTADLHLDSAFIGEDRHARNGDLLATFADMVTFAKNNDAGAVLIGGDLFDIPTPSPYIVSGVKKIIEGAPDIRFFAVSGNHDPLDTCAFYKSVPDNMYVFGSDIQKVDLGGCDLYGASVYTQPDRRNVFDGFLAQNGGIFLCHGDISSDCGFDLSRADVERSGIDLLLMGHIHKTAEYAYAGPRGLHAGVPAGRGFDECGEKGFYLVDSDTKTYEFIKNDVKIYKEYTVDVTGCNDIPDISDRLNAVALGSNEIARAVLVGGLDGSVTFDTEVLQKYCPKFIEIKDKTELCEDVMKNADEQTLEGEFIRLMLSRIEKADDATRPMLYEALKEGVGALRCKNENK